MAIMACMGDVFPVCLRCGVPVERNRDDYTNLERMHWVCFHYEYEHLDLDPDIACGDPGCPARAFDPSPRPTWFEERESEGSSR